MDKKQFILEIVSFPNFAKTISPLYFGHLKFNETKEQYALMNSCPIFDNSHDFLEDVLQDEDSNLITMNIGTEYQGRFNIMTLRKDALLQESFIKQVQDYGVMINYGKQGKRKKSHDSILFGPVYDQIYPFRLRIPLHRQDLYSWRIEPQQLVWVTHDFSAAIHQKDFKFLNPGLVYDYRH
ncbi:hypothetical protein J4456_02855 [Candidatus Pacearchaeota archaeon]|nr:hypothetical protein [Candidatus Pacearchaeota archaeon]